MDENSEISELLETMSEKTVLNTKTESSNQSALLPDFSISTTLNDSSEHNQVMASLTSAVVNNQNDASATKSKLSNKKSVTDDTNNSTFNYEPMNTRTVSSKTVTTSHPIDVSKSVSSSDVTLLSESDESLQSRSEQNLITKPKTTFDLSSENPISESYHYREENFRFTDDSSKGKFRIHKNTWLGDSDKGLDSSKSPIATGHFEPTSGKKSMQSSSTVGGNWPSGMSKRSARGWTSDKFSPKKWSRSPNEFSRNGNPPKLRKERLPIVESPSKREHWRTHGKWQRDDLSSKTNSSPQMDNLPEGTEKAKSSAVKTQQEASFNATSRKKFLTPKGILSEPDLQHSMNKRTAHSLCKEQKDRSWIVRPFSRTELQAIVNYTPTDLTNFIHSNLKRFIRTLDILQKQKQWEFDLILNILYSITECIDGPTGSMACIIIAEVLSERCAQFLLQLRLYSVSNLSKLSNCTCSSRARGLAAVINQGRHNSAECTIISLSAFFQKILQTFPSVSWKVLPIIEFSESVEIVSSSPNVCKAMKTLVDLYEQNRELLKPKRYTIKQVEIHHQEWDNSEFRAMPLFPDHSELCNPDPPVKLRPSIIQGSYKNWMHYYDVQFRLLKEDFTAPLRRGICGYIQGLKGRNLRDIRIYRSTTIKKPIATRNGVNFQVQFDISGFRLRNWEHSKRLLFGSLLCLSNDNFKTIFFAVVTDRDVKNLENGVITVEVPNNIPIILAHYAKKTEFTMIESSAYFEASCHIMASLQTAETDTMPFTQYLIANKWDSVNMPHYLQLKDSAVYDLTSSLTINSNEQPNLKVLQADSAKPFPNGFQKCNVAEGDDNIHSINIIAEKNWELEGICLDPSQLNALKTALTQVIALIQGPPGTGKTFIGIKIVQALLANREQWDNDQKSPILVMCYTNHALDQFLEGILIALQRAPKMIRIGGRSKSQLLEPFKLSHIRKNVSLPQNVRYTKQKDEKDFNTAKKQLDYQLNRCDKLLLQEKDVFLTLKEIQEVMHPTHLYQLLDLAQTPKEEEKILEIWLGLCTKITLQEGSDKNENQTKMRSELKTTEILDQWPESDIPSDQDLQQVKGSDSFEQTTDPDIQQKPIEDDPNGVSLHAQDFLQQNFVKSPELIDYQGEGIRANSERILDDEADNHFPVTDTVDGITEPEVMKTLNETEIKKVDNFDQKIMRGLQYTPLKEEEVEGIDNLANIYDEQVKWKLYNYWRKRLSPSLQEDCQNLMEGFSECCTKLQETNKRSDKFVLETAEIIGMTTTGVAKYQHILHMVKPRIVIVEEAAEVLESHIVSALNAGTQHLILIGDHKQLKPKPNEYYLAKHYNMNVSLFERLLLNKFPCASLNIQHRMRPEIADLVRPYIYRDLQDHDSVQSYDSIRGIQKNLFFIQHEHTEGHDDNLLSFFNMFEAQYVVSMCNYFLLQGYEPKRITILTTYIGQLLHIRSLMPKDKFNGVTLQTVDNYQGEENDIVLLSLVRCNQEQDIGFLKEENRVCVSISRAKKGFYCIGNFSMLAEKSLVWKIMIDSLKVKNNLGQHLPLCCSNHPETVMKVVSPIDFETLAPEGGCQLNCRYRLKCGHVCARKCHTQDSEHLNYVCKKPCAKTCPNGHICPQSCYQKCVKCVVKVTGNLPTCGHQKEMFCYQNPSEILCKFPCQNTCSQGHNCPLDCYQKCKKCEILMPKLIPNCQHIQMIPCHQDPNTFTCMVKCSQMCPHGHPCSKSCHRGESCGECDKIVEKVMPECCHKVLLRCSVEPIQRHCTMPCEKLLKCGHKCQAKCGENCTVLCNFKVLRRLSCDHYSEVPCVQQDYITFIQCKNKCEKLLPCNHPCQNLCYQSCTKQCELIIDKVRPCGHSIKINCYQSVKVPCKRKCEQVLQCGHPCFSECGKPCRCSMRIKITLPCGHFCRSLCGESQTEVCKVKVKKTLSCGHSIWTTCSEQNPVCNTKVLKILPCGHMKMLFCHEDPKLNRSKCDVFCKTELACGHRCSGICGDCSQKRFHQPCKFGFELQRFCGHKGSVQCVDMSDIHPGKQKKHLANCIHQKCSHNCFSSCSPCEQPCPWTCPHHSCTKLCHEVCKRLRCDKRCSQQLKCGHQCYGVCGEPCLTVCPECQQKKFKKFLVKPNRYDPHLLYIQLKCNHLFSLNFFDKYVVETANDVIVSPLCCPQCKQPLTYNYRYGDSCKQHLIDNYLVQSTIERITVEHFSEQKALEVDQRLTILEKLKLVHVKLDGAGQLVLYILNSKELVNPLLKTRGQLSLGDYGAIDLQEYFLMFLLLITIEHIFKLLNEPHVGSVGEWLPYLKLILSLVETKCQLSVQIIKDLSSELYHLSLIQQIAFVNQLLKKSECVFKDDKETTFDNQKMQVLLVEQFLNEINLQPSIRIDADQYIMHSMSLSRLFQDCTLPNQDLEFPVEFERVVRDIKESTPPCFKGVWRKCPLGHVYCTPLTLKTSCESEKCVLHFS